MILRWIRLPLQELLVFVLLISIYSLKTTEAASVVCDESPTISLSEDDLVVINVGEDDSVMISLFPVVNSNSIDPQCITTYEERTFDFELPFCDHESRANFAVTNITWSISKLIYNSSDLPVSLLAGSPCIEVTCSYDSALLLSSSVIESDIRKVVAERLHQSGTFTPVMTLYKDELLSNPLQAGDVIEVPNFVFVSVSLQLHPSNTQFYVQMVECWMTPTVPACSDSGVQFPLFIDGCPIPPLNHLEFGPLVEISRNYLPTYGIFRFRTFIWKQDPRNPIFLHCKVRICDNESEDCGLSCDSRKKRDVRPQSGGHLTLSSGPIYAYSSRPSCRENNGGCSDVCSIQDDDVILCSCPVGKTLMEDEKTCGNIVELMEKQSSSGERDLMLIVTASLALFAMLLFCGGFLIWKTRFVE